MSRPAALSRTRVPSMLLDGARTLEAMSLPCVLVAGTVDNKVYTLEKVNEIAAWILDADRCPTDWDVVLNLRQNHA